MTSRFGDILKKTDFVSTSAVVLVVAAYAVFHVAYPMTRNTVLESSDFSFEIRRCTSFVYALHLAFNVFLSFAFPHFIDRSLLLRSLNSFEGVVLLVTVPAADLTRMINE